MRLRAPDTQLKCYGLPFSELSAALVNHRIDVLWTASEAEDVALSSTPLGKFWRMGVVAATDDMAHATSVPVTDFANLPMMFDPSLPKSWMAQFYLGDIRSTRQAQLIEIQAQKTAAVMQSVASGMGTTVVPASIAHRMGPHLHAVALAGAPAAVFYGSTRRNDRRGPVRALLEAIAVVVASGQPEGPVT